MLGYHPFSFALILNLFLSARYRVMLNRTSGLRPKAHDKTVCTCNTFIHKSEGQACQNGATKGRGLRGKLQIFSSQLATSTSQIQYHTSHIDFMTFAQTLSLFTAHTWRCRGGAQHNTILHTFSFFHFSF